MFIFLSCVILMNSFFCVQMIDIAGVFKLCDRDDPDLDDCLENSIQSALTNLSHGIPDLRLIPLDPMHEKEVVIEYKQNQISGKAMVRNIVVKGFGKAKVHAVRTNIHDDLFEIEIDMSNKQIDFEGNLSGEGRLNALSFRAKGYFNNTMTDVVWTWKLTGKPEIKKGKTYMRIVKFFMRPDVGNMKVHIPNIFGDNAELNKIAYDFSNTYWRTIYRELLPIQERTWEMFGIRYVNRIFLKIPFNELFPSSSK